VKDIVLLLLLLLRLWLLLLLVLSAHKRHALTPDVLLPPPPPPFNHTHTGGLMSLLFEDLLKRLNSELKRQAEANGTHMRQSLHQHTCPLTLSLFILRPPPPLHPPPHPTPPHPTPPPPPHTPQVA
jgi:hypothetical protein